MNISLDKIEIVKDRTGVSYKKAKEALTQADGSVIDAIILLEDELEISPKSRTEDEVSQIVETVKKLVKKGNVSKIVVKKDGKVVLDIPVNLGLLGVLVQPWAMLMGTLIAVGTRCSIDIVKDDGNVINVSDKTYSKFDDAREKGGDVYSSVRERGGEAFSSVMEKGGEAYTVLKDKAADVMKKVRSEGVDFTDEGFDPDRRDIDDDSYLDDLEDIAAGFEFDEGNFSDSEASEADFFDDDYFNFDDFDESVLEDDSTELREEEEAVSEDEEGGAYDPYEDEKPSETEAAEDEAEMEAAEEDFDRVVVDFKSKSEKTDD